LVKKWIPCDLLWTLKFVGFEFAMRLKGNEEYCPKEIEEKINSSTLIILEKLRK
jgi:hypothetical protein